MAKKRLQKIVRQQLEQQQQQQQALHIMATYTPQMKSETTISTEIVCCLCCAWAPPAFDFGSLWLYF